MYYGSGFLLPIALRILAAERFLMTLRNIVLSGHWITLVLLILLAACGQ